MTEQELNELRDKLTFFSEALFEGDNRAVNVPEINSIAIDLVAEVRRLQSELEEARNAIAVYENASDDARFDAW